MEFLKDPVTWIVAAGFSIAATSGGAAVEELTEADGLQTKLDAAKAAVDASSTTIDGLNAAIDQAHNLAFIEGVVSVGGLAAVTVTAIVGINRASRA
jgi:hypothetical protein